MATVGETLIAPESGWRRYDDRDSRFQYIGAWTKSTNPSYYMSTYTCIDTSVVCNENTHNIKFKFYGSKIRIIGWVASQGCQQCYIVIDGVQYAFSQYGALAEDKTIALNYENLSLELEIHNVELCSVNNSGRYGLVFDAIDIDDIGYLLHPILTEKTDIQSMEIGDCIRCRYTATSGKVGVFTELGTCDMSTIPVTGTATPDGLFYFIKVDDGLLIADRVLQHTITWDALNNAGYIEGTVNFDTFITEKVSMGSNFENLILTLKTNSTTWEGSNAALMQVPITPSGIVTIEYDALFNDFYSSAANHTIQLCTVSQIAGVRDSYYNLPQGSDYKHTPVFAMFNTTQPSNNAWHHYKWTIDLTNKTISLLVDGSTYIVPMFSVSGATETLYLVLGVGSYNYAANFQFKNITINQNGVTYNVTPTNKLIRSLSGGCAYATPNGNLSLTNMSAGGWPVNNEWDTYIVNSDLKEKIIPGDTNIWHHADIVMLNMCRETPVASLYANTYRVARRNDVTTKSLTYIGFIVSSTSSISYGFRPALEYIEDSLGYKKPSNLWY